jgi:beta-glucosidase
VAESVNAGVDLEMPGVNKFRSPHHISWSIQSRKVTLETIKCRARKVLELVQKCAKGAPEVSNIYVLL